MYKCYFCEKKLEGGSYFIGSAILSKYSIEFLSGSEEFDKLMCKDCFNLAGELITKQKEIDKKDRDFDDMWKTIRSPIGL